VCPPRGGFPLLAARHRCACVSPLLQTPDEFAMDLSEIYILLSKFLETFCEPGALRDRDDATCTHVAEVRARDWCEGWIASVMRRARLRGCPRGRKMRTTHG
jgi:hypothetical protein